MALDYHTPTPRPRLSTLALFAFVVGVAGPPFGILIAQRIPELWLAIPVFFAPTVAACVIAIMAMDRVHASRGEVVGFGMAVLGIMAAIAWVGLTVVH